MSNLNNVALQGNLVDEPKLAGKENEVVRFTIAVNNGFGEHENTTYVDCVGFGKQAAIIGQHFHKGKQIIVRGQLIQNRWEDKDGNKRSKLEVRLENFNGFNFVNGGGGSQEAQVPATEKSTKKATKAPVATNSSEGDGKLF